MLSTNNNEHTTYIIITTLYTFLHSIETDISRKLAYIFLIQSMINDVYHTVILFFTVALFSPI